jgi:hypothetical protein
LASSIWAETCCIKIIQHTTNKLSCEWHLLTSHLV